MTTQELANPSLAGAEAQAVAGQPYVVESKWCGILLGGFGSENDIATIVNRRHSQGYRLASTKMSIAWWMMFIPRHKLLMFFERV
jgi:hypothetical protein